MDVRGGRHHDVQRRERREGRHVLRLDPLGVAMMTRRERGEQKGHAGAGGSLHGGKITGRRVIDRAIHADHFSRMPKSLAWIGWVLVAALGAAAIAYIAVSRGETINAAWIITAAVCAYLIAYRFYSKIIASNIFALNAARPTPATRLNDGRDYVPTNRWIVFGHHFAAIAGPGPLVGPTLAAQFGFLPGMIWIIVGVALGGAVQDGIILMSSTRRDGRSLGQMARDELGPLGGLAARIGTLLSLVVLSAVLGLVIVNAMKHSPWATSTVAATIPVAILIGLYLR